MQCESPGVQGHWGRKADGPICVSWFHTSIHMIWLRPICSRLSRLRWGMKCISAIIRITGGSGRKLQRVLRAQLKTWLGHITSMYCHRVGKHQIYTIPSLPPSLPPSQPPNHQLSRPRPWSLFSRMDRPPARIGTRVALQVSPALRHLLNRQVSFESALLHAAEFPGWLLVYYVLYGHS